MTRHVSSCGNIGGNNKKYGLCIQRKNCVKQRFQWWCKLVVDFPSLNDCAKEGGWGVINPRLVVTRQAKMRCCGGWARTQLLWLVLGRGTNFLRPRHFFRSISLVGFSTRNRGSILSRTCQTDWDIIFNQGLRTDFSFSKPQRVVWCLWKIG